MKFREKIIQAENFIANKLFCTFLEKFAEAANKQKKEGSPSESEMNGESPQPEHQKGQRSCIDHAKEIGSCIDRPEFI